MNAPEEVAAGDVDYDCEFCGDRAVGRFVLTLDLDPLERFPAELEDHKAAQERAVYEMYVCRICLQSDSSPCVICELASHELEGETKDTNDPPARAVDMFEALYALEPRQRGAILGVVPKKLQAALAAFWKAKPEGIL